MVVTGASTSLLMSIVLLKDRRVAGRGALEYRISQPDFSVRHRALLHFDAQDLPFLALDRHLEWPATDLAIGGERLGTGLGIDPDLGRLAAKRAVD